MELHWPQGGPKGVPTVILRQNRNFQLPFLGKNLWPRDSRKFEFWGMVIFYGFDPFFTQCDPIGPQDRPHGVPTVIWHHNRNFHFLQKIRILGHGNFSRFWPIFWTQWDPIGPKIDHRVSPPWFVAITVTSIFWEKWKIRILGHGNFYAFDPFFGPNGTPLAQRWTLGGPHGDL